MHYLHGDRRDSPRFQADLARLFPEAVVDVIPMDAEDTRSLAEALRGRMAHSVYISSGDVYAPVRAIPIAEEAPTRPAEPAELHLPNRVLPRSKVAMEAVVRQAHEAGLAC